jgi:hypothetical protein
MKTLLLLLILPVLAVGQTVHVKDKEIVYEGKVNLGGPPRDLTMTLTRVLAGEKEGYRVEDQDGDSIKAKAKMRLATPHHLIRYVNYNFKLRTLPNGYEYVIDSVFLTNQERGEKADTLSSKKLLDNMEDTGDIVGKKSQASR